MPGDGQEARMTRSLFAATILLTTLSAVPLAAETRDHSATWPGDSSMQAPPGHRQPTRWLEQVGKDNAQLDAAGGGEVTGANEVQSEENALARRIEEENDRLDAELRGICRGC